jgi:hypothetical protein
MRGADAPAANGEAKMKQASYDVAEALRWRRALAGSSLPAIHFRLAHFAGLD